jgi:transcriptional regulator with XRE-family HTH domain
MTEKLTFNPQALETLRRAHGWWKQDLGKYAGVSAVAISLLESGKTKSPRMETLNRLAEALEVPPHVLLQEDQFHQHAAQIRERREQERREYESEWVAEAPGPEAQRLRHLQVSRRREEVRQLRVEEAEGLEPFIQKELERLGLGASPRGGSRSGLTISEMSAYPGCEPSLLAPHVPSSFLVTFGRWTDRCHEGPFCAAWKRG